MGARGAGVERKASAFRPALRAQAKEFQGMGDRRKAVAFLQIPLDVTEAAVADVEHLAARAAHEVVVVVACAAAPGDQLEAGLAVAELAARHDPRRLEVP